jgi:hypothetical protein
VIISRKCDVADCSKPHRARGFCKGHYNTIYYRQQFAWRAMLKRCEDPNNNSYHNYGRRGIKVCRRWHVYNNFLSDMGPRPSEDYSLDRIDNDGDYTPDNCRWATVPTQRYNSRVRSDNRSGYKGVSYHKGHDLWRARFHEKGREVSLGWYKTKDEAILARQKAEELYLNTSNMI